MEGGYLYSMDVQDRNGVYQTLEENYVRRM